jgi:hypothetical protein
VNPGPSQRAQTGAHDEGTSRVAEGDDGAVAASLPADDPERVAAADALGRVHDALSGEDTNHGDREALARRVAEQPPLEEIGDTADDAHEPKRDHDHENTAESPRRVRAWTWIAAAWLLSRAVVFAAAAAAWQSGWWPSRRWLIHPVLAHPSVLLHALPGPLGAWDAKWYEVVAAHGYFFTPGHQSDPAFFPLLPLALSWLHALGVGYLAGGVLLANVGFLVGLIALYELGREYLAERDARRAAIFAAIFPAGYVFSMAYPEGLALAALALAGLAAVRGHWLASAVLAAAAALARPEGVLVALPLGVLLLRRWPVLSLWSRACALAATLAAPAALASLSAAFSRELGDPLAWSTAEHAWNRRFSLGGIARAALQLARAPHAHPWLLRDAGFCLVYLVCLAVALRARVPGEWVAFGALVVLLPVASGTFESDARFGLLALPVYWGLAVLGRRPIVNGLLRLAAPFALAAAVFSLPLKFP